MGNKLLRSSRKSAKKFETPVASSITTYVGISRSPQAKREMEKARQEKQGMHMRTEALANAQRNFVKQTGQIPDKVGLLEYADNIVKKLPQCGHRWRRGFFMLCETTLYIMSTKGKILRCYVLTGSYCKEGAPRLSSFGTPVGRPTILLFEALKKLSMNTNDVLNKLKGEKDFDGNKRRYHNNLLVPFLRLKAMNRDEHDSWILVLKQTVNKSITQAISPQKHGMSAHGAEEDDNYVRISSPILQKVMKAKHGGMTQEQGKQDKVGQTNEPVAKGKDASSTSPGLRRQLSYEVIDEEDIESRRRQLIADTANQLKVTYSHALALLRQFKWNTVRLLSETLSTRQSTTSHSDAHNSNKRTQGLNDTGDDDNDENEIVSIVETADALADAIASQSNSAHVTEEFKAEVSIEVADVVEGLLRMIERNVHAENNSASNDTNPLITNGTSQSTRFTSVGVTQSKAATTLLSVEGKVSANDEDQVGTDDIHFEMDKIATTGKETLCVPTRSEQPCLICYETADSNFSLACGHVFCKGCWVDFLTNAIKSGTSELWTKGSECPSHMCTEPIPEQFYKEMLSGSDELVSMYAKYQHYATNNFVDANVMVRWCPGANCNRAVYCKNPADLVRDVTCDCGTSFCFSCGKNPHSPASCDCAARWKELEYEQNKKQGSTGHDSAGAQGQDVRWLAKNTRPCPKCKVPIQKFHGCNHMTCHNQRCQHEFCWVCLQDWSTHGSSTGGYYRCFVNDPVKTKNMLRQLRFEQHDEKNSGDREQLYKRCGMLRYKAQTASYMMLDFLNTGKQVFGSGHGGNGETKGMQQDILIDACDKISRSYAFLNWGHIVMYDQLSKLVQDKDDGGKDGAEAKKARKKTNTDAKYSSVAAEVFHKQLQSVEEAVQNAWKMIEPLHRIYAVPTPAKRRQSPSKLSKVDGTQQTLGDANHDMFLVQRRLQHIENGMVEVHKRMVACRQFATVWQRTDKENDAIFEARKKQIYNDTGVERPSASGEDEEKVSDLASTNSVIYNSLLHPKHEGTKTERWSCLLCKNRNSMTDKFCKICLSKHEHPLLEQEITMFRLKCGSRSGKKSSPSKLKSVSSRWRQFQQAELRKRSRRSLTRRSYNNISQFHPEAMFANPHRPPPPAATAEQESQLIQLQEMGFTSREEALGALRATDGDLNGAVSLLLVSSA